MSDEELVKRLRAPEGNWLTDQAADRIEALVKERDMLRLGIDANIEKHRSRAEAAEAEVERLKAKVEVFAEYEGDALNALEAAEAALKGAVEVVKACDWKFEHDGFAEDSIARMTTRAFLDKHHVSAEQKGSQK